MPILGNDLVIKCHACTEIVRLRIADASGQLKLDTDPTLMALDMMKMLVKEGWEVVTTADGVDYACFRHGKDGSKKPKPPLKERFKIRGRKGVETYDRFNL